MLEIANINKAETAALALLQTCGIDDPTEIPLPTLVQGLGCFYRESPLNYCEGRIVSFGNTTLITINSLISNAGKKRYAIAHELGHFAMHRKEIPIISDTEENFVDWLQRGIHETEANQFAAEFLMPRNMFKSFCAGRRISPQFIIDIANRFQTSLTSTILRYVDFGTHEVCVVYVKNNKMKWWRKSKDFYHFVKFKPDTPPPSGSVAFQMFNEKKLITDFEQKQQVWKSDWFEMNDSEADKPFFEFCVYVPSAGYSISLIWEEKVRR